MIDLTCPKCGGIGRIPNEKVNTRLNCRKCHAVFHVTASGRSMLGDPPAQGAGEHHHPDPHHHESEPIKARHHVGDDVIEFGIPVSKLVLYLGLLAILALVVAYVYFPSSSESLVDLGKAVAQNFADGKLDRLRDSADPATVKDLDQWYTTARTQFETMSKLWGTPDVIVGAVVMDESREKGSGLVMVVLVPTRSIARNETISSEAGMNAGDRKPMELTLHFTLDGWGKWRLDGKKMLGTTSRS